MIVEFLPQFILGTWITIKLAICSLLVGMILGLIGVTLQFSRFMFLRFLATSFVLLVRGLPELLVLFFIYFGVSGILSNILGMYMDISAFVAGVAALSLIFSAYAMQVFRGALLAVDAGQIDAGFALGLTHWQIFKYVQLPQAWRHAIPGLGNLWLVLLKDTSIVMLIGLNDLMNAAKLASSSTQQPFTYYLLAAFIYLLLTTISQRTINYFQYKANHYL